MEFVELQTVWVFVMGMLGLLIGNFYDLFFLQSLGKEKKRFIFSPQLLFGKRMSTTLEIW